jgi:hypothetical protein
MPHLNVEVIEHVVPRLSNSRTKYRGRPILREAALTHATQNLRNELPACGGPMQTLVVETERVIGIADTTASGSLVFLDRW